MQLRRLTFDLGRGGSEPLPDNQSTAATATAIAEA
jgi:hypothetical protein